MSDCIDITLSEFGTEVVNESKRRPVMVDCWAPWCGPCKQLKPVLEHLCTQLEGQFRLAKIDTDAEPELARQLDVSSIPDVRLFVGGKQVDRFVGFKPAKQVLAWLRPHMPSPADEAIARTEQAIAERSRTTALRWSRTAVHEDNENPRAFEVQVKAALLNHDHITARAALGQLKALPGTEQTVEHLTPLVEMEGERFAYSNVDPRSIGGRYGRALAAIANEDYASALEHLLDIVQEDKDWEDGKAHKRMLDVFNLLGKGNEVAEAYRSKLAMALY